MVALEQHYEAVGSVDCKKARKMLIRSIRASGYTYLIPSICS